MFNQDRMKAVLAMFCAVAVAAPVFAADKITTVKVGDQTFEDITDVHIGTGGLIIIRSDAGAGSASADKLPADFLESWGITKDMLDALKSSQDKAAKASLDAAIKTGAFRVVDGVVYDTRKPQAGWVRVVKAKVIQIIDEGAIVDLGPDSIDSAVIFVRHLPAGTGDTDMVSFLAKQTGTYSYINKLDDERTIKKYDLGRIAKREEIPESVLDGKKSSDVLVSEGAPQMDVTAKLPDSEDLQASGTGFFVSEDGFLITNFHVVRGASRVSVKTKGGVFAATVTATDKEHDLALLKVSGHFKPLPVTDETVELGESAFTIGFPDIELQGIEPKYTDGKISGMSGLKDDPKEYQISVPVQPGNSGGPLVNKDGNVIGVVVARLDDMAALAVTGTIPQNVNYAVKAKYLRELLFGRPEVKTAQLQASTAANPAAAVQESVAMVLVY